MSREVYYVLPQAISGRIDWDAPAPYSSVIVIHLCNGVGDELVFTVQDVELSAEGDRILVALTHAGLDDPQHTFCAVEVGNEDLISYVNTWPRRVLDVDPNVDDPDSEDGLLVC